MSDRFDDGRSYIEESIRRKESAADADALEAARLVSTHNFNENGYAALVRRIASVDKTVTAERRVLRFIDKARAEAARRTRVDEPKQAAAFEEIRREREQRKFREQFEIALSMLKWALDERGYSFEHLTNGDMGEHVALLRAVIANPDTDLLLLSQAERVINAIDAKNPKRKKAS